MPAPHRFSLEAFRRYETAIQTIVLNYPNIVTISPAPFSCETFCARCRDAIRAYLDPVGRTWTSVVDRDVLSRVRPEVVFTHDGSTVRVGPKETVTSTAPIHSKDRPQFTMSVGMPAYSTSPQSETNNPTEAFLLSLLQDVSSGQRSGPVHLTGKVPLHIIESAVSSGTLDVEYIQNPDGSVVLL